ncbi:hypothetical protein M3193_09710 [Sporosarcina luteola]|uniref:hypothetical protein n=1 Tax=Sporosarcina luteola TaxID=582850 RepID=UPI00203BB1D7|nr:hypothetical protein [Sporosarcina luteola]MCM3744419.1 hypothetical protein [Sporosarcina luteola]
MNKALRYMFWGYFLIFFRLHVMIDILMDPIGYYLIFAGCSRLVDAYPKAKKTMNIGLIGMLVSVPSVFVNLSDPALSTGWTTYAMSLSAFKLITAYYLFVLLTEVVKTFGDQALQRRTKTTFTFYVAVHLITLAILSFSMNMPGDDWIALTSLVSAVAVVIMDILFLLLIGAIRRVSPEQLRVDTFI